MATKRGLEVEEQPNKRSRLDEYTPLQADKERAVGITAFVSPDIPGFHCIVKQRYTDFLVNEILPDGRVLHLESLPDGKKKPRKDAGPSAGNNASAARPTPAVDLDVTSATAQPEQKDEAKSDKANEVNPELDDLTARDDSTAKQVLPEQNGAAKSEQNGHTEAKKETAPQAIVPEISPENKALLEGIFGPATTNSIINLHAAVIQNPLRRANNHRTVYSEVLSEKSKRTEAHGAIRNIFSSKLETATLQDQPGVMTIRAAPVRGAPNANARSQLNDKGANGAFQKGKLGWEELGGEYLHFTLHKENKDTMEVLFFIASQLKVPVKNFQFAGTKDRRGVTVQRVAIFRMHANRLIQLNRMARGWVLGAFEYKKHGLDLGELTGNEFVITLRDCQVMGREELDGAARLDEVKRVVWQAAASFQTHGFLNYYGLQRFGTFSTGTHVVGMKMLKGDLEGAIDAILTYDPDLLPENQADNGDSKIPQDDIGRAAAIHTWRTTGKLDDRTHRMPRRFQAENAIMQYLGRMDRRTGKPSQAKDWQGALMQIQRNLRLMYVHAYQSRVWNTMISKRWELFGSKVVEGDLVIIGDKDGDAQNVKDEVDQDGEEIVHPAADDSAPSAEDTFTRARHLTKDEAESGKYDIFDVVLPLPGFDVLYPANAVGKFYEEFMASEEGGGLDPHNMRRAWKDVSLSGGYRKMMSRPGKGFKADVVEYEGDDEQLVQTDLEKIKKQEAQTEGAHAAENGNGTKNELEAGAEVASEERDGAKSEAGAASDSQAGQKKIAVVLRFQLGSSQYATMALLELTKGGAVPYKPDFSTSR